MHRGLSDYPESNLKGHIQLLGEAAERQAAQHRLLLLGLGATIAILFLLEAAFQSVRLAAMMFLTLPVALAGGILAAWLFVGAISLGALAAGRARRSKTQWRS